jgi:hypothetical protein
VSRKCSAAGCDTEVPTGRKLRALCGLCAYHWKRVPDALRDQMHRQWHLTGRVDWSLQWRAIEVLNVSPTGH